jgi:hypothetical protein
MSRFIARQPNGKFCRFDTDLDDVTDINMSERKYVIKRIKEAQEEAKNQALQELENEVHDFSEIKERFRASSKEQLRGFKRNLKFMGDYLWWKFDRKIDE